jgi:thiol-disulfide isomerase/thioredoxin
MRNSVSTPRLRITLSSLAVALALSGCSDAPPAAPAATPDPETPAATAAPAPSPAAAAAAAAAPAPAPASTADATKPEFPTLAVETFDGGRFDLAEHKGRWVVVNFWATWCNPCLKEIPDLIALDAAREDVDVVGLAYEEIERADMDAFLAKRPIPYPMAVLDVYSPPADFDTPRGLPMTYLISPDGRVARKYLGPVTSEALLKVVDAKPGA